MGSILVAGVNICVGYLFVWDVYLCGGYICVGCLFVWGNSRQEGKVSLTTLGFSPHQGRST